MLLPVGGRKRVFEIENEKKRPVFTLLEPKLDATEGGLVETCLQFCWNVSLKPDIRVNCGSRACFRFCSAVEPKSLLRRLKIAEVLQLGPFRDLVLNW